MDSMRFKTVISGKAYESEDIRWREPRDLPSLQDRSVAKTARKLVLRGVARIDGVDQPQPWGTMEWPEHEVQQGPERIR